MVATLTADAVDREAAWLNTTGDGLPALQKSAGGPWDNVQAYYTRTPYGEQRTIYVLRNRIQQRRFAAQRIMHTHPFRLILWWPLLDQAGSAEADARAFDVAIDVLLQRILGPLGDKTHGGRFLSVGENAASQGAVDVEMLEPEQTIPLGGFSAHVTYSADDREINA
jgi:hypothetical protein